VAIAGLAAAIVWTSGAAAQSTPGVVIGSDKPQAPAFERSCVEVEIGGEKAPALNCLNRRLRGQVDKTQTPSLAAPLDANSPDVHLGISNPSAVRQQFGTTFGTGAPPQRPPR
jgi:hypothetical protein